MYSDDPNANKRASYAEQAARAGAVPPADDAQPEDTDASVARRAGFVRSTGMVSHSEVDHQLSSEEAPQPPRADNIVTGEQPPLYGGAAHRERSEQPNSDDAPASGGSSTSW